MQDFETNPYASPAGPAVPSTAHYQLDETTLGTWKSFQHENGKKFREFNSHAHVGGLPLLHFTSGKSPETNRRKTAVGLIDALWFNGCGCFGNSEMLDLFGISCSRVTW